MEKKYLIKFQSYATDRKLPHNINMINVYSYKRAGLWKYTPDKSLAIFIQTIVASDAHIHPRLSTFTDSQLK